VGGARCPTRSEEEMEAVILSVSSSLDNFAVGFSLGLLVEPGDDGARNDLSHNNNVNGRQRQQFMWFKFNLIISFFNAIGALFSSIVGSAAHNTSDIDFQFLCTCLSSAVFLYLGLKELFDAHSSPKKSACARDEEREGKGHKKKKKKTQVLDNPLALAVPMTLNNLAGGLAGGLTGRNTPVTMFGAALAASYILMESGRALASSNGSRSLMERFDERVVSGMIFLGLAVWQFLG
jgi:putative Mn2+ efflux pump MntP